MRKGQLLLTALLGGIALGGAMPAYEAEAALKREPVGTGAERALQAIHDSLAANQLDQAEPGEKKGKSGDGGQNLLERYQSGKHMTDKQWAEFEKQFIESPNPDPY
jgi:hypothetical protein